MDWADVLNERRERERNEATETKSLRTLMQVYDPEGKDRYATMGLGELRGTAQAMVVRDHMRKMQQEEQDREAEKVFYRAANPAAPGGMGPDAPLTPARMLNAAAQSGYHLPPQVLAQMVREGEDGAGWQLDPRQIQDLSNYGLPGQVFVPTSKGGGQVRSKFDPSQFMDVEGFTTVPGKDGPKYLRNPAAKTLPASYNETMSTLLSDIQRTENTLANNSDEQLAKTWRIPNGAPKRAEMLADIAAKKKLIADHVARHQEQGYASEEFWTAEKQRLGLAAKPATAERVQVSKGGKVYTVPASQLADAEKQGYQRVTK